MDLNMKPSLAVDEMFSEVAGYMDMEESGSATGMMMDHLPTPTNDKHVHADFYNDFDDLFDDDDNWAKVRGANDNGSK
ncbi:COP9 signalosome complex subunit 9 homolog [Drosophila innubila]|uniref:COP9 signalosome complex subunit 9 homolog n=1 Tax=Drosophila innubila TaxID=198719 RepID=UPI00148C7E0B|nr:COP9 signalosome complex subunit 9 homolog [Drosophila innubila]